MSLQVWLPLNGNLNNQGLSGVTVTNSGATVDTSGKIGSCYSFDGSSNRISIKESLSFNKNITISAWIKPTNVSSTTTQYAVSYNTNTGGTDGHLLGIGLYGSSTLTIWYSGTTYSTGVSLVNNTWYHIAVTRTSAGVMKVYVNGSYKGTATNTNSPSSCWLTIGSRCNSSTGGVGGAAYFFKGSINDVRFYDTCLTPKEIKEISKGLVCHYKLDGKGFGNSNLCPLTSKQDWASISTNTYYTILSSSTSNFGLSAGDTYTWSVYVKVPTTIKKLRARVQFYNSGSDRTGPTGSAYITDGEGLISVTGTVLSGYSEMHLCIDYNASSDVATTNVVCYYKMPKLEKGSKVTQWVPYTSDTTYTSLGLNSTTEHDNSGYKYDGTLSESLSLASDSPRYGECYYFNSTSKRITLPAINMTGFANSFSISWYGKAPSYSSLMYWGFSNGNRLNYYNGLYCNTGDGGSNPYYKPNTTTTIDTPSVNVWHHFVMVGDGSSNKLYMDGTLYGVAKTYKGITGTSIVINGWDSSTSYKTNGYISDFRIYSTALSADDVKELYDTSASVDKSGNIFSYEFREE